MIYVGIVLCAATSFLLLAGEAIARKIRARKEGQ